MTSMVKRESSTGRHAHAPTLPKSSPAEKSGGTTARTGVGVRNAESPRLLSQHSLSLSGIVNNCSIPGESIQVAWRDREATTIVVSAVKREPKADE